MCSAVTAATAGLARPQLTLLALAALVVCGSACFIRNCPIGGKRALEEVANIPTQRKCLRCGPSGLGQCIGPDICCGADIGCYLRSEESAVCVRENDIPVPCEIEGERCGADGSGTCVAESLCCDDQHCRVTSDCSLAHAPRRMSPEALDYLRRLLVQQKIFDNRR